MSGEELLCNAVIVQAAKDYRNIAKRLKKHPEEIQKRAELRKLERFFCSDWFQLLSKADGTYILERLRKEVN